MARLFSRELTELAIAECNADPQHLERAALLTGTVILRAFDTPDGHDVQITYQFDKGRCVNHRYESALAPAPFRQTRFKPVKDGLARISAAYATWVKLDRGDIEPADALESPDYTIEANTLLLMPLMQSVNSWSEKVRAIEKDY
jgi:hypothetical protein